MICENHLCHQLRTMSQSLITLAVKRIPDDAKRSQMTMITETATQFGVSSKP